MGKDDLVDCLLDFLGSPSADLITGESGTASNNSKQSKTRANKKKASTKTKEAASEDEDATEDEIDRDFEVIEHGTMPTEKQLRQWVVAYVRCFSMDKVTLKHALQVAGDKFGVDLTKKKKVLKKLLTEEM